MRSLPIGYPGIQPVPQFTGKTVIVTGAGAGLGQGLAVACVQRGAHVIAISRGADGLRETRRQCEGASGRLDCHVLDVVAADELEQLYRRVVAERGRVDLLVNCAAVYPRELLKDTRPEDWTRDAAINLNGVAFSCRAATLTFHGHGVILNAGSFAYLGPDSGSSLYCATKAAVNAFTQALAAELKSSGSTLIVNEWVPQHFPSRMNNFIGSEPSLAGEHLAAVWDASLKGAHGQVFHRDRPCGASLSFKERIAYRFRWMLRYG